MIDFKEEMSYTYQEFKNGKISLHEMQIRISSLRSIILSNIDHCDDIQNKILIKLDNLESSIINYLKSLKTGDKITCTSVLKSINYNFKSKKNLNDTAKILNKYLRKPKQRNSDRSYTI